MNFLWTSSVCFYVSESSLYLMFTLMLLLTHPSALPYRMHMEENKIWPLISHYPEIFHTLSASRPITGRNRCSVIQWKSPARGMFRGMSVSWSNPRYPGRYGAPSQWLLYWKRTSKGQECWTEIEADCFRVCLCWINKGSPQHWGQDEGSDLREINKQKHCCSVWIRILRKPWTASWEGEKNKQTKNLVVLI